MSTNNENGTMKKPASASTEIANVSRTTSKLATGLILGTLAFAGMAATGCDEGDASLVDKSTSAARLIYPNHNETFLVA